MNKSDLINRITERSNSFNKDDLDLAVNIVLNIISNSLSNGDRVEIRNFGTFSSRPREQRLSRNPKTGTSVLVDAKYHPYFRASKYLKESLNK